MPRFFIPSDRLTGDVLTITGEDAYHIARALRMAAGEEITVCTDAGDVCRCTLTSIRDDEVLCRVEEKGRADTEPPVPVTLCFAWSKGDKPETIIQKAVETGACRILPFFSERCVARPPADRLPHRVERLRRVAAEAAKQCGRSVLPRVEAPLGFAEMLAEAAKEDLCLFCYEGESARSIKAALDGARAPAGVCVIVGAEGGFSEKEAAQAERAGALSVHLGRRILRCETAPTVALAAVCCRFEL